MAVISILNANTDSAHNHSTYGHLTDQILITIAAFQCKMCNTEMRNDVQVHGRTDWKWIWKSADHCFKNREISKTQK